MAGPHIDRPPGRPPKDGYEYLVELEYKAESWKHAYRVVLVVVDRPDPKTGQLELFPDYFFLITDHDLDEGGEERPADPRSLPTARHLRGPDR